MIVPFIRDEHIGYICVHFTDADEYTRWGVSHSWKDAGEYTLSKLAELIDEGDCATQGISAAEATLQFLADRVVEAAHGGLDVLPCRSYALMQAFGAPFILIEATRQDQEALRISALAVCSAAEADQLFDDFDETGGSSTARYGIDGEGSGYVAIPVWSDEPLPSGSDLTQGLPDHVAATLAEALDDPELRSDLVEAMRAINQGGHPYVH